MSLTYFCYRCGKHDPVNLENHVCQPQPTRISPEAARRIAEEIVADIMKSGCGTQADHLNLFKDDHYLSGWSAEALERQIAAIVERVGNAE